MRVAAIVAYDSCYGIAKNGVIPWRHPEDLKNFRKETWGNTVIMGRKTWETIPGRFLEGRNNIILSRTKTFHKYVANDMGDTAWFVNSVEEAMEKAGKRKIFIIGGEKVYKEFFDRGLIEEVIATQLADFYECDKFFVQLSPEWYIYKSITFNNEPFSIHYYKKQEIHF